MRKSALLAPMIGAMLGALAFAAPASAATSGTTPVTLAVTGGTLDITAPVGPVNLGSVTASSSAQTVTGQLGNVEVVDGRGGTTGWTATASAVDFVGPGGATISVSAAGSSSYTAPTATVTGTATVANTNLPTLFPAGPVQAATGVSGINTATWNPTISVTIPANTLVGTYTSTVTHSVS